MEQPMSPGCPAGETQCLTHGHITAMIWAPRIRSHIAGASASPFGDDGWEVNEVAVAPVASELGLQREAELSALPVRLSLSWKNRLLVSPFSLAK